MEFIWNLVLLSSVNFQVIHYCTWLNIPNPYALLPKTASIMLEAHNHIGHFVYCIKALKFLFQRENPLVHKASFMKTCFAKVVLEEPECPAQNGDLNLFFFIQTELIAFWERKYCGGINVYLYSLVILFIIILNENVGGKSWTEKVELKMTSKCSQNDSNDY